MRGINYGTTGAAAMDPRLFMVQATKKCLLNNENIIRMYGVNEEGLSGRIINSTLLIGEMVNMLNVDSKEEVVKNIETLLEWLIERLDLIKDMVDQGKMDKMRLESEIRAMDKVLNNLLEGFEGMGG